MNKGFNYEPDLSSQLASLSLERDKLVLKVKEYERLLSLEPEQFLQYAEKIGDIFYQTSLDLSRILYLNPAAEKILEICHAASGNNSDLLFDCIHSEDRALVKNALHDMVEKVKERCKLEYRLKRSDGSVLYVLNEAVLIKGEDGKPASIMGVIIDITRYVKAQKNQLIYEQVLFAIKDNKSIELLLNAILKTTCHAFDWDVGEIWILDKDVKSFYCIATYHKFAKELEEFYELSRRLIIQENTGFQGYIIEKNAPVFISDFPSHEEYYRSELAEKTGVNAAFGLPIVYDNKVLGVMSLFSREAKIQDVNQSPQMLWVASMLGQIIQHNMSNDKLLYITQHDDLTGLLNRNGLEDVLKEHIEGAGTRLIAVIMMDLDRFSLINDSMGFDVADILLKELALKFKEDVGDMTYTIANLGGDHYVFVSDYLTSAERIKFILDRIQVSLSQRFIIKDQEIHLTASMGVSIYPYDGMDTITLLRNADIALKQAKLEGGNTVQFLTRALQETLSNAMKTERGLRHALSENQLRVYYQPKVDLKSGEIVGLEALIRWEDPAYGLRLPDSFLRVAEESDLIVYMGEWVLMEVCYHFPLIDLQLPVAINLSARQFKKQYNLVNFITELTRKLSVSPALLELEVTESQLMENPKNALETLLPLKKMGITIAIDDFGTGYSSFDYLRRFKVDRLKIDKSFIDGLPFDAESVAIVRAMIVLSHALGMKVIAEGVERADQLKFLRQEGCDEMQGFYFSKALSIYELKALLASGAKLELLD